MSARAPRTAESGAALAAATALAGAKTRTPVRSMRKVCSPGRLAWPRIFMISILRTIELRWTLWRSQIRPSATVNTGLASVSLKYSPTRKVVACQLVISMPSCCTNSCRLVFGLPACSLAKTTERNESTKTSPGL